MRETSDMMVINGRGLGHWFELLDYLLIMIELLTSHAGFTSENFINRWQKLQLVILS